MNEKDFSELALIELEKLQKRRVQVSSPVDLLKELFKGIGDPQPAENNFTQSQPLPEIVPQYPRLLIPIGGTLSEYVIANNDADWAPYHHWYSVFPPQQPASRPITTTLEAEVEKLKAAGFKERPKEDWERRKQQAAAR